MRSGFMKEKPAPPLAPLLLLCWSIDPAVSHSRLAVASLPWPPPRPCSLLPTPGHSRAKWPDFPHLKHVLPPPPPPREASTLGGCWSASFIESFSLLRPFSCTTDDPSHTKR